MSNGRQTKGGGRKAEGGKTLRVRQRGFTLIEALAAVVLLGIGIAGAMGAVATITRTESAARETERMQSMAQAKLAELVATGEAATSTSGDFADEGEPDVTWSLETGTSGIADLNTVSLTLETKNGSRQTRLDTLVYQPPATTATTGAAN